MRTSGLKSDTTEAKLYRILKLYWGFTTFRPLQLEAVKSILSGKDVLLILPTGGGKSLAFQVPALSREHAVTIVICPLIALAKARIFLKSFTVSLRDGKVAKMHILHPRWRNKVLICQEFAHGPQKPSQSCLLECSKIQLWFWLWTVENSLQL